MRFIFSPDSQIMVVLSRICDLVILNVVFVLTCIPLFTIGPALAALNDVCFRLDTSREGKLLPTYFRAFRENFLQGTLLWLLLLLMGAASCVNMARFSAIGGSVGFGLCLLSMGVLILILLVHSYVFPLLSRYRNTTLGTLRAALLLALGHFPRALAAVVIHSLPWLILLVNVYTFLRLGILWLALYFAAATYLTSRLLLLPLARQEDTPSQTPPSP